MAFKMKGMSFGNSPAKQTGKERRKIRKLEKEEERVADVHAADEAYDRAMEEGNRVVEGRIEFHKTLHGRPLNQITEDEFAMRDNWKREQKKAEKNIKKARKNFEKTVRKSKTYKIDYSK